MPQKGQLQLTKSGAIEVQQKIEDAINYSTKSGNKIIHIYATVEGNTVTNLHLTDDVEKIHNLTIESSGTRFNKNLLTLREHYNGISKIVNGAIQTIIKTLRGN